MPNTAAKVPFSSSDMLYTCAAVSPFDDDPPPPCSQELHAHVHFSFTPEKEESDSSMTEPDRHNTNSRSRMISRRRGLRLRGVLKSTLSSRRRANAERALIWNWDKTHSRLPAKQAVIQGALHETRQTGKGDPCGTIGNFQREPYLFRQRRLAFFGDFQGRHDRRFGRGVGRCGSAGLHEKTWPTPLNTWHMEPQGGLSQVERTVFSSRKHP